MAKSLVIVESPAKAKTINKYLGSKYVVKSSIGHIRDLPVSASQTVKTGKGKTIFDRMGIYPENDWKANYQILPGKEKVVDELKKIASKAETIFLATDLDREGEAIAWHLQEIIDGDKRKNFQRVVFNEITKTAINKAFEHPRKIDSEKVNAQQARRFLDRLVGFMISPLLWQKVARGLSAGRVQSVASKLIVEREHEIQKFIPQEYWRLFVELSNGKKAIEFEVSKYKGKKFYPTSGEQIRALEKELQQQQYRISERKVKPAQSRPSPPFITATLQQAASTRLGYSVKRTMIAAQKLYEAGFITYMRTDSTNVSLEAISTVRDYIHQKHGDNYVPENPRFYSSKGNAQEAHEAIRPTQMDEISTIAVRDGEKLYKLIRSRFIASQMADARFENTNLVVQAGDFILEAKGRVKLFDGYTKEMDNNEKALQELPPMQENEILTQENLRSSQHFTKPLPRYSEATLVRELEKRNIGRPSTYAPIISTIQDRGYVRLHNKRFHAEKIGEIVTQRLNENFADLMNYDFTASMEEKLDAIATGKLSWKEVLNNFYDDLTKKIASAKSNDNGMKTNTPIETDIPCGKCGRNMNVRYGSSGVFLGCSGYALKKEEQCTNTVNLISCDDLPKKEEDYDVHQVQLLQDHKRCKKCNSSMTPYLLDNTNKLHLCSNSPECVGMERESGQFIVPNSDAVSDYKCDVCGKEFVIKSGRFGKYFACSGEDCSETRSMLVSGAPSPKKMKPVQIPELKCNKVDDFFVLRDGANGMFLAASKFPKHRETRPALVKELLPYRDEIDSKYHFLLDGPKEDPQGNPAQIRFSRKHKCQYLTSEENGKQSKWVMYYNDSSGSWSANR